MAWSHNSNSDKARSAATLLDEAVVSVRNRGFTKEHALRLVAQEFGLRMRRARSILFGEPVVVMDDELARIREAFLRHLDAEAEDLATRSRASRERWRRMQAGEP